jgi:hypothetical protein
VEGIVLVGDAGGYNGPIIGHGLSLALRDVRLLSEILLEERGWAPPRLERYVMSKVAEARLAARASRSTALRKIEGDQALWRPAGVPCSCCWCRQRRSSFALRLCLEEVELSIKTAPSQSDSHELAWSYSCYEGQVE